MHAGYMFGVTYLLEYDSYRKKNVLIVLSLHSTAGETD